jgi:NADH-ubiquinone oxidoreductase chain 2
MLEFIINLNLSKELILSNNSIILIISKVSNIPYLILISSLLSLIIGSILGLSQIKIKRLLAYSTISHIGFILLALSINTSQSIDSFIFYILQYTLTNLNIFLIILGLSYLIFNNKEDNKDINFLNEFMGLFNFYPILSICLCVCLFSMAGIPPLIGFFSKQFVLYASIQNGYYLISFIGILVSVISASYYLKIVKLIISNDNNINKKDYFNNNEFNLSNIHSYVISCLTLFILLFFINPNIILNSTQLLSLSLFYI